MHCRGCDPRHDSSRRTFRRWQQTCVCRRISLGCRQSARRRGRRERRHLRGAGDGSTPLGFDHEPSPSLLSRLDLSGRSAMLATANGTPAILAAVRERAALILLGSLGNLDAVARSRRRHRAMQTSR
ncbi:2-phosphosulfolactate phosphatase [Mesorhizobium sp.]|uniref:2-phosphosulfolactate phosphatase n=1 Tax=Mesorhizobium sp. TaxID=1871066 RepID=UPI000FEA85BB|nr:MAG: hypothetical protein EOR75_32895 [Mesorhizobium sp.]